MTSGKLDKVDIALLQLLQEGGRITRSDLAKQIGKSIPVVSERMRRLEEAGVISGYKTLVNPRKVGLEVMAFVVLQVESSTHFPGIIEHANEEPQVLECHALTGEGSHLLKLHAQSTAKLERLLATIQSWPGVKNTRTSIVLSSPKHTTTLPLEHLLPDDKD